MVSDSKSPIDILSKYWGFGEFRGAQGKIINNVIEGGDTLAILPTGGGKSVCYQVPAVALGGLTVVISPLIALMQDQVDSLNERGIRSTFINSHLSLQETERRWNNAEHGHYRLLYLAPERCDTELFRARASHLNTRLMAVDEAHCISEWGPDFRPSYLRLAEAAELLGRPPIIAVTATATPEVRKDIIDQLELREPLVVVQGFDRENIIPSVFHTPAKLEKLKEILTAVDGTAIVYVTTRRGAEGWAERLRAAGFSAEAYHGAMGPDDRLAVQQRWQRNETRIIAATNAFGMGIDKPDVRLVVHVNIPASLEAYYQEAGRAGRDGRKAWSVLLFSDNDISNARSFIEESRPALQVIQRVYDTTLSMAGIAVGSAAPDPFLQNTRKVAESLKLTPLVVRSATEVLIRNGIWEKVEVREKQGLLQFRMSADQVKAYAAGTENPALRRFILEVVRGAPVGAYREWTIVDLEKLEKRTGLDPDRLLRGLKFLEGLQVLSFMMPDDGAQFKMTSARTPGIDLDSRALRQNRAHVLHRLEAMIRYARSITCRRHHLLAYFGESSPERCGRCDICLGRHRPTTVTPEDEERLRELLKNIQKDDPPEKWLVNEQMPTYQIHGLTDWLVSNDYIKPTDVLSQKFELTPKGEKFVRRS